MSYLLIHGDANRLPIDPACIDAVVTDPPYGMDWNVNGDRYTKGGGTNWAPIKGDDQPFDPSSWIKFQRVVLWGLNHFGNRLPVGTTLIWIKRADEAFGSFLSDAELAWLKGGHGIYCHREYPTFNGRTHPTQKPIALMRWCIQKLKLKPNSLILDPYCGSGSTLIAALQEGHRVIGMDLDRHYLEVARRRIERPHQPIQRAGRVEHHPLFEGQG